MRPRFTQDWFTPHIPLLTRRLMPMANQADLQFLEIGCFEGRSSCWFLQNILTHPTSKLTCIDTFTGNQEHSDRGQDVSQIEQQFDSNIQIINAQNRTQKIKAQSADALRNLPSQYYDFIYIDGSHLSKDVLTDAVLSWPLLVENGLLLFDDYNWNYYKDPSKNPKQAIDAFLTTFASELTIVEKGYQVLVQKKPTTEPKTRTLQHTSKKIVGLAWVGNEADIIEYWVRHNLSILDKMVVVLHQSTDGTEDILQKLKATGCNIEIRRSDLAYHGQGKVLTALLHEIASEDVAWFVPIDADEFLWATNGDVKVHLLNAVDHKPLTIPWRTYVPTAIDNQHEPNPCLRLKHRRVLEPRQYEKVLIPRAMAKDVYLKNGSHAAFDADGNPIPATSSNTLFFAHMPIRTEYQLRNKILRNWKSSLANPDRKPGESFQWEQLYERCQDNQPITAMELEQIATRYALQPADITPALILDPLYGSMAAQKDCGSPAMQYNQIV